MYQIGVMFNLLLRFPFSVCSPRKTQFYLRIFHEHQIVGDLSSLNSNSRIAEEGFLVSNCLGNDLQLFLVILKMTAPWIFLCAEKFAVPASSDPGRSISVHGRWEQRNVLDGTELSMLSCDTRECLMRLPPSVCDLLRPRICGTE